MADFPVVPIAPGVPTLLREPGVSSPDPLLLLADTFEGSLDQFGPQWGIFKDGAPAVLPDSIRDVGYQASSSIMDYPVERGSFETYNKVANPFDARVVAVSGGTEESRQEMLETIDEIQKSLDLFDVVTPEKVYLSANIVRYGYNRSAERGVGMIAFDIFLREVRVNATAQFTSTQSESGANTQDGGAPQTQAATTAQETQVRGPR